MNTIRLFVSGLIEVIEPGKKKEYKNYIVSYLDNRKPKPLHEMIPAFNINK